MDGSRLKRTRRHWGYLQREEYVFNAACLVGSGSESESGKVVVSEAVISAAFCVS